MRTAVETAASRLERPLRRLTGGSAQANPLPHAGTISVFLLIVVVVSGVYITLFYQYGFEASYGAVAAIDDHPVQGVVRALHRYASAALVLTTVVHAWRIFVAGRFTGGRRYRWLTGLLALTLVWLAGVTGYFLVWDQRAQALGEAVLATIGRWGWGSALVVDHLVGTGAGSGSGVMLVVWLLHLALTVVIGWFVWRHLRRNRLPNLPPRYWMVLMLVALIGLSVVVGADLLPAADPGRLVPQMSLDPFMLFLLPPLLSDHALLVVGGLVAVLLAAAAIPWLLRDRSADVVLIDVDACTGCELCVVDCPYIALRMSDRAADRANEGQIAVVDPAACVGCGICVGSCSFGALRMPGVAGVDGLDVAGRSLVVACARHTRHGVGDLADDQLLVPVTCTGMFHASAVGDLVRRGASSVQIVGCSAGDCVYGVGNVITHARLHGDRSPHVPRGYADVVAEDYVAVGELAAATRRPGSVPDPDASVLPGTRRGRMAGGGVVLASVVAVSIATLAPFGGRDDTAAVRVIVAHTPGTRLVGQLEVTGEPGADVTVEVTVDGVAVVSDALPRSGGRSVGVVDVDLEPGAAELDVSLIEGGNRTALYAGPVLLVEGRRFLIEARDVPPPPTVGEGRRVFDDNRLGGCNVCHSTKPGDDGVGPSLAGVATVAAGRVPGLDAAGYLRQSVLQPDAYVVPGWPAGQMIDEYDERLSADQLDAVVAYLLTLEEVGS